MFVITVVDTHTGVGKTEMFEKHVLETIFKAAEVGLDGVTEDDCGIPEADIKAAFDATARFQQFTRA